MDQITDQKNPKPEPPSHWWTVRAFPAEEHGAVLEFLGDLESWVKALYPKDAPDLESWKWELDAFIEAILASASRSDLADAWRRSERPGKVLAVPGSFPNLESMDRVKNVLSRFDRVTEKRAGGHRRFLDFQSITRLALAGKDSALENVLVSDKGRVRVRKTAGDEDWMVAALLNLGCKGGLSRSLLAERPRESHELVQVFRQDPHFLWEYLRMRKASIGAGDET